MTPARPTPGRTTPPSSRTGTTVGSDAHPTGLLFPPPAGTGYTPPSPRTTTPYTPPTYTPPAYTPPDPTPVYRPPVAKKSNGCAISCLVVAGGFALLTFLGGGVGAILGALDEAEDPKPTATAGPTSAACPSRIASTLPSGKGSTLVEAFRTQDHRITLCRTKAGKLYYYGEFRDGREAGIAMPAKKTSSGYEANNSPYRYVISDGAVSIYKSGSRIGHEELSPEPSPS
ncbi:hypothetical protein [Streptomyces exfoliatus]|uniref:hypothetical protein n=1 Tax=Streptomyces exfoliatus TaxID=1905 RepID=UPI003C2F48E4